MTQSRRVGDLEITEDLDAQRRNWKFQRIGTVVMASCPKAWKRTTSPLASTTASLRSSSRELQRKQSPGAYRSRASKTCGNGGQWSDWQGAGTQSGSS
jgi:hypothetical protein